MENCRDLTLLGSEIKAGGGKKKKKKKIIPWEYFDAPGRLP